MSSGSFVSRKLALGNLVSRKPQEVSFTQAVAAEVGSEREARRHKQEASGSLAFRKLAPGSLAHTGRGGGSRPGERGGKPRSENLWKSHPQKRLEVSSSRCRDPGGLRKT